MLKDSHLGFGNTTRYKDLKLAEYSILMYWSSSEDHKRTWS